MAPKTAQAGRISTAYRLSTVMFEATIAAPPGRMLNPSGFLGQKDGARLKGVTGVGQAATSLIPRWADLVRARGRAPRDRQAPAHRTAHRGTRTRHWRGPLPSPAGS